MKYFIFVVAFAFCVFPSLSFAKDFPDPITEVKRGMTIEEVQAVLGPPIVMEKPERPDDENQQINKDWVDFYLNTECRVYLRKKDKVDKRNYSWLIIIFHDDKVNSFSARLHNLPYCNGDFK